MFFKVRKHLKAPNEAVRNAFTRVARLDSCPPIRVVLK